MSQRKEKYARSMERRTGILEERVKKLEEAGKTLGEYGSRLDEIEETMEYRRIAYAGLRKHEKDMREIESRRQRREIRSFTDRQRIVSLITLILAVAALILAAATMGSRQEVQTERAVQTGYTEAMLSALEQ